MPKLVSKLNLINHKGGNLMGTKIDYSPNAYNQDYMNQLYPDNVGLKDNIYVDTQTSTGWHNQNDVGKMYSVGINAGYNDYVFSRTTPDNKFITTTGLELHKGLNSFELVGGKKKEDLKKNIKNSFLKTFAKIKKSGENIIDFVKSKIKKDTVPKSKPKLKTTLKKDTMPKSKSKPKTTPKKDTVPKSKSKPKTTPKKDTMPKSKPKKDTKNKLNKK